MKTQLIRHGRAGTAGSSFQEDSLFGRLMSMGKAHAFRIDASIDVDEDVDSNTLLNIRSHHKTSTQLHTMRFP